jgi:hypothetical protein
MIATCAKFSAMTWLLAFAIGLLGVGHAAEVPVSVALLDIDSGTTSPQGNYRWMDVADQVYAATYRDDYDYTQASVRADFFTNAATLHGTLTATNLKPHFAYQFKLVGDSGTEANERIGLAGRWWREEWNGAAWVNGQNLNDKGDGTSPSPNDEVYLATRDILDATSPTGRRYRYTGYLVFHYFITDASGNASVSFEASSSYHVLWKTSQRSRTAQDGPLMISTFDVAVPDPVSAYDVDYPESTVSVFGEWERLPVGGVTLPLGDYEGQFILTEESFHGSGLAGGWAAAMGAPAVFHLVAGQVPALQPSGLIGLASLLFALVGIAAKRRGLHECCQMAQGTENLP